MEAEPLTSHRSAVARLKTPARGDVNAEPLGTAFVAGPQTALTSFHCVGDMNAQTVRHPDVVLHFIDGREPIGASVIRFDANADFAVLRLAGPLSADLQCLRLVRGVRRSEVFWSWGFPTEATLVQMPQVSGKVEDPAALLQTAPRPFR